MFPLTQWWRCKYVYICASLLHLAVESRNLSQAEKKIQKMKIVVILWVCLALQALVSFLVWNQSLWSNSQQPKASGNVDHLCTFQENEPFGRAIMQVSKILNVRYVCTHYIVTVSSPKEKFSN